MTTWRKNEPTAARRRCVLVVSSLVDGSFAPANTDLTGKLFYRAGDDAFVAASGTLSVVYAPLVQADNTFTVDAGTDVATLATSDPPTGAGPFTMSSTTTLPGGLATATDYWWIRTGEKTGKFAASLADALTGTEVDITDAGSGTHTLADTTDTEQPVPGKWLYEATQTEANASTNEVEITVIDAADPMEWYGTTLVRIDHGATDFVAALMAHVMEAGAGPKAQTFAQRERIVFSAIVGNAPDDLNASPYYFRDNPGGTSTKDRGAFTMSNGIRTVTDLDGDE